jgi:hypothetical protein
MRAAFLSVLAALSLAAPARAQKLRELSTDRPDRTESPYTVDRGHLQLELDFLNVTHDAIPGGTSRAYGFGAFNAKVGITHAMDLQLVSELYGRVHERDASGRRTYDNAVGNLAVRLKVNLWGNDGGRTALALMPFVGVPRGDLAMRAVEGGLIVPLAIGLPRGWSLGVMPEVDVVRRDGGVGRQVNLVQTVTVGHDVAGPLAAYAELAAELIRGSVDVVAATANGGFTLAAGPNAQFDVGANLGLNAHAERVRLFIGMARRY